MHILCSGSNDHASTFWTRNRLGDEMRDKYNLNTLPLAEDAELLDNRRAPNIPGVSPEDKMETEGGDGQQSLSAGGIIPGLDVELSVQDVMPIKKVPYAKPIPRNFQDQWNENHPSEKTAILPTPNMSTTRGESDDFAFESRATLTLFAFSANDPEQMGEMIDSMQLLPVAHTPTPVIVDGTIEANSELEESIGTGEEEQPKVLTTMGLKVIVDQEETKPEVVSIGKELDDFYSISRTPFLDDSTGYKRGHSTIGPTPTGGILGGFPRGNYFICELLTCN